MNQVLGISSDLLAKSTFLMTLKVSILTFSVQDSGKDARNGLRSHSPGLGVTHDNSISRAFLSPFARGTILVTLRVIFWNILGGDNSMLARNQAQILGWDDFLNGSHRRRQ